MVKLYMTAGASLEMTQLSISVFGGTWRQDERLLVGFFDWPILRLP
jgi:hypothetical protein